MDGVTPNGRHSTDIGGISNVAFQVGPKFVQIRWRPQPSRCDGHCNSAQIGFYGVEARWKPQRSMKNKTKEKKIARDSMQVQKIQSNLRTLGPPLVDSQQKPSVNCSNGPKIQSKLVKVELICATFPQKSNQSERKPVENGFNRSKSLTEIGWNSITMAEMALKLTGNWSSS